MLNKISKLKLLILFLSGLWLMGCSSTVPSSTESEKKKPEVVLDETAKLSVAHDFFVRGRYQEMLGNQDVALDFYSIAFEYDSTNKELSFIIAEKYKDLGNIQKGLQYALKGLELPGEVSPYDYKLLGELYLRKGRLDTSLYYYKECLKINEDEKDVHYILLTIYEQMEDEEGQIASLKILIPLMNYSERLVDKLGNLYRQEDQLDSLEALYRKAWEVTRNGTFGERLASVFESLNQMPKFMEVYQRLHAEDPKNSFYQVQIARAHIEMDNIDSALAIYKELMTKYPEKESFVYAYASILFSKGQYEQAKPLFLKLLTLQPENDLYHYYLGSIADHLKDNELAESEYHKALSLNKSKNEYWAQLGFFLLRVSKFKEANKLFEQMVLEKEKEFRPKYLAGIAKSRWADHLQKVHSRGPKKDTLMIHKAKELRDTSIRYLNEALKTDSTSIRILFELGAVQEKAGLKKESVETFKKLISLDSNNAMALNYLGYMLVELDQELEYAGTLIDKALEKEPENGAYLDSKGWLYYRLGNFEKAKEYIEKALNTGMNDVTLLEHLALILEKMGQMDRAKEQWSLILKLDPFHKLANSKLN